MRAHIPGNDVARSDARCSIVVSSTIAQGIQGEVGWHADANVCVARRPELLLSDRHLQVYLIKQLMESRHSGQQQSGGAASSPSVGESPHSGGGGGGSEHQQQRSLSSGGCSGGWGADAKALLALNSRQRVRLLSLLVQLETQRLAMQARHGPLRPAAISNLPPVDF